MPKSGEERSYKYSAKFDAEVVRSRYTATAENAKAKQVVKQGHLATIAGQIRGILNTAGIDPMMTIMYLSFANKLYAIVDKFGGGYETQQASLTAVNVATTEMIKWGLKGADWDILSSVWGLFPTALGEAPACPEVT